jgi:anti-sigma B factor antagonist
MTAEGCIVSRMGLILNTRRANGHIIVEASGRLEMGEPCIQLRDLAKRLTSDGGRMFILNMAGVSNMDSSGIGLLLSIYATIRNQGGDLKLLNVGGRVKELLNMTKLTSVFQIFDDEDRAITAKNPEV